MAPRSAAPLLVAALLCAAAAAARGATIKATASTCADIGAAFNQLSSTYSSAKTSATITLQLTFNCTGVFNCTDPNELGTFSASPANTNNGKQPAVKIVVTSGSRCRTFESAPKVVGTDPAVNSSFVFNINSTNYPETRVDVSISFLVAQGFADGYLAWFSGWPNTRSTLTVKKTLLEQASYYAANLDSVTVSDSVGLYAAWSPLEIYNISKSVSVQGTTIAANGQAAQPYPGAVGIYNLGPKAKVSMKGNNFGDNAGEIAKAVYIEFNGEVSAQLPRNSFVNNYGGPAPYTLCVHNLGVSARRPSLSVSGSSGLDPSKPSSNKTAPWPTSVNCSVAAFTQA